MDPLFLSIIVPIYNEQGNLGRLTEEIAQSLAGGRYPWELILINDGSSDRSWEVMAELAAGNNHIRCIDLAGNHGQSLALRAGIEAARGEVIIAMDGDLQHDPAYIPEFMAHIEAGYDLVGGYKESSPDSRLKRGLANLAHGLIALISGVSMRYFGATFKAYRRYLLEDINLLGDMHRFLGAVVARKGIRFKEIPIRIRQRGSGQSSYRLSKSLKVVIDLIFLTFFLSYMHKPFRLFGMIGGLLFAFGLLLSSYFVLGSLLFDFNIKEDYAIEFLTAMSTVVIGLLFVSFGLTAEISAQIYYSKTIRSPFQIRRTAGQDATTTDHQRR
jgi:glycosyltransferase involved in cell wall biosynthesis